MIVSFANCYFNEKCTYFSNPDKRNQWLDIDQVIQPVLKRELFSIKVLLCVWWSFEGVIHFELILNDVALDTDLCCAKLNQMFVKLHQKNPSLFNRKHVLLQQYNAKPHTTKKTVEKIKELDSVELLPDPAYSPDLSPSDYHLFQAIAHFLTGRTFNNVDEVERRCLDFFGSKDKESYHRG